MKKFKFLLKAPHVSQQTFTGVFEACDMQVARTAAKEHFAAELGVDKKAVKIYQTFLVR